MIGLNYWPIFQQNATLIELSELCFVKDVITATDRYIYIHI